MGNVNNLISTPLPLDTFNVSINKLTTECNSIVDPLGCVSDKSRDLERYITVMTSAIAVIGSVTLRSKEIELRNANLDKNSVEYIAFDTDLDKLHTMVDKFVSNTNFNYTDVTENLLNDDTNRIFNRVKNSLSFIMIDLSQFVSRRSVTKDDISSRYNGTFSKTPFVSVDIYLDIMRPFINKKYSPSIAHKIYSVANAICKDISKMALTKNDVELINHKDKGYTLESISALIGSRGVTRSNEEVAKIIKILHNFVVVRNKTTSEVSELLNGKISPGMVSLYVSTYPIIPYMSKITNIFGDYMGIGCMNEIRRAIDAGSLDDLTSYMIDAGFDFKNYKSTELICLARTYRSSICDEVKNEVNEEELSEQEEIIMEKKEELIEPKVEKEDNVENNTKSGLASARLYSSRHFVVSETVIDIFIAPLLDKLTEEGKIIGYTYTESGFRIIGANEEDINNISREMIVDVLQS